MEHSSSVYKELQCSKDRKKPSDSSACWREGKLGHKEQYQRNRGKKWGREAKDSWRNSDHAPQGPPAALAPAQEWVPWTNTSVSLRQRSLTLRAPSSTGSWLLPLLHIDVNPLKSKTVPDPLIILFISLPLNSSFQHRTEHFPSIEVTLVGRISEEDGWHGFLW